MNVSVIIPVFNEKESLPDLVLELNSSLASYNTWEVIFVDDGSSDGSQNGLQIIVNRIKILNLFSFIEIMERLPHLLKALS